MRKTFASALFLCSSLSGCGLTSLQKQEVTQFATATESISDISITQFKSTRDKIIELERRRLILRAGSPPKTPLLDAGLTAEGVAKQISALNALKAYGKVLEELASNDQGEAISASASNLATQFEAAKKAQDSNYSLDEKKKAAVVNSFQVAGSWFTEAKKKEYLKKIIDAYHDEVVVFATAMRNDLVLDENSLCIPENNRKPPTNNSGIIDIYCTSALALDQVASSVLLDTGHTKSDREFSYNSYFLAQQALAEITPISKQGEEVIKKLLTANSKLENIIENDKYTQNDVKAYYQQVNEIRTIINVMRED